ncbi:carbohydrate-binding protein [Hymenobacter sp. J193]|uniref:carbohydrate-binding protein n=1 Tax=Hymenobacter sp. J193 TaxID=2898429 RepID=UPI0021514949|nr:carbohydrate-binding protein [Hymenobacter sp. J193]MCR5886632.1 carbohydrate-binding protein [Hymenobacter sp. J193]
MKKNYSYGLSAALLLGSLSAQAQQPRPAGPAYSLGSSQALVRQLESQTAGTARRQTAPTVALRVSATQTFTGKVNYREDLATTGEYLVGEVQGVAGSSFLVRIDGKKVEGNIIFRATKRAYRYSADEAGNVSVQEVDINKVICIDYNQPTGYQERSGRSATQAAAAAVVSLQSYPGARGCILLDFDGQYVAGTPWNNGNPINAAPANMVNDNGKIQALWELVSEDFRPFSMNVTTDENVFNSYPKTMRMRCIITPTNTAAPGAGGVAYISSFNWNDDTPCWVFMSDDPKSAGEAASHEVGHTLGLGHDGRVNPAEGYYTGQDNAGAWAPIMGAGYYKPVTHWSRGEYNRASNTQDDLGIMASATYNVGYRNDDHSNGTSGATNLSRSGNNLSGGGIIERTADQDYFAFTTAGGAVTLNVNTVGRYGNLDIVARLFNGSGAQIGTFDTGGGGNLNTTISASLGAGTYYVQIDGTSSGSPATDGYSDYGSLGTYSISGTAPAGTTPPVTGVATMYKDCNYTGTATGLNAGDYNLAALQSRGILDDDVSSLKVNSGYEVVLYENDNFSGASLTVGSAGNGCLVNNALGTSNWNDKATSLRVRPVATAKAIPGKIEAEAFNAQLGTDKETTTDTGGGQNVNWYETGDWLDYSVNVAAAGTYTMQLRVASANGGATLQLRNAAGAVLGSVNVGNTGGWQTWQTISTNVTLPAGTQTLRLHASASTGCNVNWLNFTTTTSPGFSVTLQAEAANVNNGMSAETTTDAGGGQNMGWVDAGDYLVWNGINFPTTGTYTIEYRVASGGSGGTISSDLNAGSIQFGNSTIPGTGGWQSWQTVSKTVTINAGTYNFGIYAQTGGWNINWVRITRAAGGAVAQTTTLASKAVLELYPNPVTDRLMLASAKLQTGEQLRIVSMDGREVWRGTYDGKSVDVSALKPGLYTLVAETKDRQQLTSRFSKL